MGLAVKEKTIDIIDEEKQRFVKAYEKAHANITIACKAVGRTRQWYYNNREKDEEFNKQLSAVEEGIIDAAETQLLKNISSGKETSLIFFLKCKAKKRGYIERAEMEHMGSVTLKSANTESLIEKAKELGMTEEEINNILGGN